MMKPGLLVRTFCMVALALMASAFAFPHSSLAASPPGHRTNSIHHAHLLKNKSKARNSQKVSDDNQGPLVYHNGPVMSAPPTVYAIFWEPSALQDGSPTYVSPNYNSLISRYLSDVGNSPLYANNTQYYDTNGHIQMGATFGGAWVDTGDYNTSDCNDPAPSDNCLTDQDMQQEVQDAMQANGWTAGLNNMFVVFTSAGENVCFNSDTQACSFTDFCAYHSYFSDDSNQPIIYATVPYAGTSLSSCGVQGPAGTSATPNNDVDADSAINLISHEQMEAVTDPEPDDTNGAWYDDQGNEIGDKCAWTFGDTSLDNGLANAQWNNNYYLVQQEWSNKDNGCVLSGMPFDPNSTVYIGTNSGTLYAVKSADGSILWKAQTGGAIYSSPTVDNNVVYVGSRDRNVYAFNANNGALLWKYQTGGAVNASPLVDSGVVYVGSNDNYVYALNATKGSRIWRFKTYGAITGAVAVDNNMVFVGSNDSYVYAINARKGTQVWRFHTKKAVNSTPVTDNGTVFIGSSDHYVYALTEKKGTQVWRYQAGNEVNGGLTIDNETVYGGSNKGTVFALDENQGTAGWLSPVNGMVNTMPVIDNSVFIGSSKGTFYSLSPDDGSQNWHVQLGGQLDSPSSYDSIVYVGSSNGTLFALDEDSGMQIWKAKLGSAINSSPAVAQNTGDSSSDSNSGRHTKKHNQKHNQKH